MLQFFVPSLGDIGLVPVWPSSGPPSNGAGGSFAGIAHGGDLLSDTTNNVLYQNTGTKSSPTWTQLLGAVPIQRSLPLAGALSDVGVPLTATATGGAMGVARTAGVSTVLSGESAAAATKTDKALLELEMPTTYNGGTSFAVTVDCQTAGSGTITSSSTTMTVSAYLIQSGGTSVPLAITSNAQEIPGSAAALTYVVSGASTSNVVEPGSLVELELTGTIVTTAGSAGIQVNGVTADV
jgi:hypothetical protein